MHRISFAPELSATFKRVSCWITRVPPYEGRYRGPREIADFVGWCGESLAVSLGFFDDLQYPPALLFRDRPRLGDADEVAHAAFVLLVVDLEPGSLLQSLAVKPVRPRRVDLDDDRLLHLVRDHGPQADFALTARCGLSCLGCSCGCVHLVSSVFLRVRFGLAGASSFSATATGSDSTVGCGAVARIPKSRSRRTVMMRARSGRTLLI